MIRLGRHAFVPSGAKVRCRVLAESERPKVLVLHDRELLSPVLHPDYKAYVTARVRDCRRRPDVDRQGYPPQSVITSTPLSTGSPVSLSLPT